MPKLKCSRDKGGPAACRSLHPRAFHSASKGMQPNRAGFTLIELLVGLAIMVMIATVVAPVMLSSLDRARQEQGAAALTNLATAIGEFEEDVHEWPRSLTQLSEPITTSDVNSCGRVYQPGDVSQWGGPYVDRLLAPTGLPVFIGTAQNQLVRDPASQTKGGNWGVLRLVVQSVTPDDAAAVDREIDGAESSTSGTIQWTTPPDAQGFVTLSYVIPARGC